MAQTTAAGSKIYISTATTAAATQSAFEALVFAEIGEVINIGEFGKVYQDIPTKTISQRQTKHGKGSYDQGMLELQVYADESDTGQDFVRTALDSDNEYGFKVTLNDEGTGSPQSPTTFYFRGKVMSFRRTVNDVDSMVTARVQIAINSDPITVAAV